MTAFKRWDVYVDPCYKLYPDVVAKITMETVLAPTIQTFICHNCVPTYTYDIPLPQVLVRMRNPDYVAALALEKKMQI